MPSSDDPHEIVFFKRHRDDDEAATRDKPLLVVVTGLDKPFRTTLKAADYSGVQALGKEYLKRNPRSVL